MNSEREAIRTRWSAAFVVGQWRAVSASDRADISGYLEEEIRENGEDHPLNRTIEIAMSLLWSTAQDGSLGLWNQTLGDLRWLLAELEWREGLAQRGRAKSPPARAHDRAFHRRDPEAEETATLPAIRGRWSALDTVTAWQNAPAERRDEVLGGPLSAYVKSQSGTRKDSARSAQDVLEAAANTSFTDALGDAANDIKSLLLLLEGATLR